MATGKTSLAVTDEDEEVVFMAQPTSRGPIRDADSILEAAPRGRFVAGEAFFNYAAFGSLREGLPAVSLGSSRYIGLAVNAVVAGFATTFYWAAVRPLLLHHIAVHHHERVETVDKLLEWPGTFSVFIGLLSDCFPILGLRRKSYMILGWVVSCIATLAIAITASISDDSGAFFGYFYCILIVIAAIAYQVSWIASLAMTVEYAQREHLYERGSLQSSYMLLNYTASSITLAIVPQLIIPQDDGTLTTHLSLPASCIVVAVSALLVIPFLANNLAEERCEPSGKVTLGGRVGELWNVLQQKVVYCIFFFLVGAVFLFSAEHEDVAAAMAYWSDVTTPKQRYIPLAMTVPKVISLIVWKVALINYDWRKVGAAGIFFYALCKLALRVPCVYDGVRADWYYFLWKALGELPQSWFELFVLVLPNEIAEIGREGVTIGLVNSFVMLISIAAGTLWDSLNDAVGIRIKAEDIAADSSKTRDNVMIAVVVYVVINVLGVATVWFLPSQKLDAQQLRAFGGYNKNARSVIVLGFVLLLAYDIMSSFGYL
ncbi:hypothetical protein P43SY_000785 [Pythium insidiosum]|uniref:Transmembrane protein n=1 Tax=Pythium insidiosum TaxID=114742 RepID=A0AAD5LEN9_PYTIN|nr:hypothetical protein P43SY_000785 [Pythium insidiosum]